MVEYFAAVVRYVYSVAPPDDSLRRAAVRMWGRPDNLPVAGLHKEEWEQLLIEVPSFGANMIMLLSGWENF